MLHVAGTVLAGGTHAHERSQPAIRPGRLRMRVLTREGLVGKGGVGLVACEWCARVVAAGTMCATERVLFWFGWCLWCILVGWFVGNEGKIPCVSLNCSLLKSVIGVFATKLDKSY